MLKGRKKETHLLKEKSQPSWTTNCSTTARNLSKRQLSGVILGCKHSTINECYSKQLFGLPAFHISYVRNINPGLPLFLFNYSDRVLHGVFEAASQGQLNIDPYGWTDGSHETPYPAQVKFRSRIQCRPLTEAQFAPVIAKNYYEQHLFWFELDRDQTVRLISLFSVSPVTASPAFFKHADNFGSFSKDQNIVKWGSSRHSGSDREKVNFEASRSTEVVSVNDHREADHGNSSSGQSYASIVSNTTTNAKTDLTHANSSGERSMNMSPPQKAWSSLFKVTKCNDEQKEVEDVESAECSGIDWESSCVAPCCKEPQSESSTDDLGAGTVFSSLSTSNNSLPTENTRQVDKESASTGLDKNHSSNLECSLSWDLPCSDGSQQLEVDETLGPDYHDDQSIIKDTHLLDSAILLHMDPHSIQCLVHKLLLDVEESKSLASKKDQKIKYLDEELVKSKIEIQRLQRMFKESEFGSSSSIGLPKAEDCSIFISGGYDGSAWISSLDCYYPHRDILMPLSSMSPVRSYGTALLNGELFIIGGLDDTNSWYKRVESYNTVTDHWANHPPLSRSKGGLAAVTLWDKIFAIGGGNGTDYFPDVEMYGPGAGRWIPMCPLIQKRFAATAAAINGMIYVVGGYDGTNYLNSFETFDPRAHSRSKPGTMAANRGCHSLVVLNEKLYSIGGYDGGTMVASMEIFEPRVGAWMMGESMTVARGYFGAVVIGDGICAIGGLMEDNNISDTVEYYSEGHGWRITDARAIGKRCHFSAIVGK